VQLQEVVAEEEAANPIAEELSYEEEAFRSEYIDGYLVQSSYLRAENNLAYDYGLSGQGRSRNRLGSKPPLNANPGLFLDKYIGYIPNQPPEPGKAWLGKGFVPFYSNVTHSSEYQRAFQRYRERWLGLVNDCGATTLDLQVAWRTAMHLGRTSVLENATTALQRNYGFPYLPGTGLKGVAHAFAEWLLLQNQAELLTTYFEGEIPDRPALFKLIKELFGSLLSTQLQEELLDRQHFTAREAETLLAQGQGSLVFFDAIPLELSARKNWLGVDALTPHFGDWYRGTTVPPTDDQRLIPLTFLVVGTGNVFTFALAPVSRLRNTPGAPLVEMGLKLLQGGLQEFGAGAKTAAGYGQFSSL
jgi:CRISPR-associated protein Cmr6